MADEIWIKHNLGTFQQPYIFQQNRNKQSPTTGQAIAQTPAIARQPSTYQKQSPYSYRDPVNYQQPNIRNAQNPVIRSKQSPYIANAQNPFIRNAQTAFTYNHRSPGTYRVPVDYQTPFTYNHRSPGTYRSPVSYRLPFTYNYRSPGTYRNPVSRQSPFINQGTTPVIYSYRSPYIFTQATTYVDDFDGQSYEFYDYSCGAGGSLRMAVWMTAASGTFPRDIRVSGDLAFSGEEDSIVYSLGNSVVYSSDTYDGTTGTDPSDLVYFIDDILVDGYTVRRTHSYTGTNPGNPSTPTGYSSLTTTAQSVLHYSSSNYGKRAFQYNVSDGDSGTVNGSLIFEKSGSTTYTYSWQFHYQVECEENDCPECCIHEDMLVSTPEGDKSIDDIKAGDIIYGYNFETKQQEETKVNRKKVLERGRIVKVNDTIVTDDHPIFMIDGQLASVRPEATLKNYHKEVNRLQVGDKMLDVNGNHITVESIEPYAGEHRVYTIKTELDNFYADEILVDSVLEIGIKGEMEDSWSAS